MRLFCRSVPRAATAPLPRTAAAAAAATAVTATGAISAAVNVFFVRRLLTTTTTRVPSPPTTAAAAAAAAVVNNSIGRPIAAASSAAASTSISTTSTTASGRPSALSTSRCWLSVRTRPPSDRQIQVSAKPAWPSLARGVRHTSTAAEVSTANSTSSSLLSGRQRQQFVYYPSISASAVTAASTAVCTTPCGTSGRHPVAAVVGGGCGAGGCGGCSGGGGGGVSASAVLTSETSATAIDCRTHRSAGSIALQQQLHQLQVHHLFSQECQQQQQQPLKSDQQLLHQARSEVDQKDERQQQLQQVKDSGPELFEWSTSTRRRSCSPSCGDNWNDTAVITGPTAATLGQIVSDLSVRLTPSGPDSAMEQREAAVGSEGGPADAGVDPGGKRAPGTGGNGGSATPGAGCAALFAPKRVLVLTKFSRLEFEKRRHQELSEQELIRDLEARGSDYQSLLHHHNIHTKNRDLVVDTLREAGLETRLVDRFEYTDANVEWADVIFTTGGDGTFLMAASKVLSRDKPVIGINSDPSRSVGYLCLPGDCTEDFPKALQKLLNGQFRWQWRQRIRVTVQGKDAFESPIELHNQQLQYPEYRFIDCINEEHKPATPATPTHVDGAAGTADIPPAPAKPPAPVRILPIKSLNEVFVGESLSSRVSYYEISIDGSKPTKVKSSGVTMCTGTGSTSWSFNISKVTPQCVKHILEIVQSKTGKDVGVDDQKLIEEVTAEFNDSLIFDPSDALMAYTIRDPVFIGTDFSSKPRGFAKRIEIRSRMFDACIVIDGSLSFIFNDGAIAVLEILEQDGLKTVAMD